MSETCGACRGDGWTVEVEHEAWCGSVDDEGFTRECSGVQVQVKCPTCDGIGHVPSDGE
jgi:DnaJ-class molecular chaperone